jgi:hypothetical protein
LQHELDALLQQTAEAADDAPDRPEAQKQPVTPTVERRGKAIAARTARGRGSRRSSPNSPLAPAVVHGAGAQSQGRADGRGRDFGGLAGQPATNPRARSQKEFGRPDLPIED